MFETWTRSWTLVKQSYAILLKDKELMWFPILSGVITIGLLISFIIPLFVAELFAPGVILYSLLFVYYILSYFIVIFFNVGLVACARIRLQGGDPTVKDGMNAAIAHLPNILLWAVISATVGLILRMISDKLENNFLGQLVLSLLGMAWTLLTFFVVPVMIFENKTVFESIKGSTHILKKTWGETVVGQFSMGGIFFLLGVAGIVPMGIALLSGSLGAVVVVGVIVVMYWIVLSVVSASLQGIYLTALYHYARTGKAPEGFDGDEIKHAFVRKGK